MIAGQRADLFVEYDIMRFFMPRVVQIERLEPLLSKPAGGIKLALDDIELPIDLRKALFRLDQDQAVHPVRDMRRNVRGGAVVNIKPRIERLPLKGFCFAREDLRNGCAASRAVLRVEIDRLGKDAFFIVLEV